MFQPIAADDVAPIVAEVALAAPRNGIIEIAGPERAPFNEIVARYLKATGGATLRLIRKLRPDEALLGEGEATLQRLLSQREARRRRRSR